VGTKISGKPALTAAEGDKIPVDRSGSDGYVLAGDIASMRLVALSQASYDALNPKDSDTYYFITS
jgi:hypothetical protein